MACFSNRLEDFLFGFLVLRIIPLWMRVVSSVLAYLRYGDLLEIKTKATPILGCRIWILNQAALRTLTIYYDTSTSLAACHASRSRALPLLVFNCVQESYTGSFSLPIIWEVFFFVYICMAIGQFFFLLPASWCRFRLKLRTLCLAIRCHTTTPWDFANTERRQFLCRRSPDEVLLWGDVVAEFHQ